MQILRSGDDVDVDLCTFSEISPFPVRTSRLIDHAGHPTRSSMAPFAALVLASGGGDRNRTDDLRVMSPSL